MHRQRWRFFYFQIFSGVITMQSNTEQKNNYFRELALNLQREGFIVAGTENGLLSVEMDGQHLPRRQQR